MVKAGRLVNTDSIDGFSHEIVELGTGRVFPADVTPVQQLDRCFDLESFMKVSYGPATEPAFEKFLLPIPVDKVLKVSDKFIDADWQPYLRTFTNLQRIAQRFSIPNMYAVEAMRFLMKRKRGMFSENMQIHALIFSLQIEPRLWNRIDELEQIIMPRKEAFRNIFDKQILERLA